MTFKYYYTSNIGVGLPFGTQKTAVTGSAGIYNAITGILTDAGWTQYNQLANPPHIATSDTWFSTGESGNESIAIWTQLNSFMFFYVGTVIDSSSKALLGGIGGTTANYDCWGGFSNSIPYDFNLLCTKDFIWANFTNVPGGGTSTFTMFMGNVERTGLLSLPTMISTGGGTQGSSSAITFSVNPRALGYNETDKLQIIDPVTGHASSFYITAIVQTGPGVWQITADFLLESYNSGSRVGVMPCPVARFVGTNVDIDNVNQWYVPFTITGGSVSAINDFAKTPVTGNNNYAAGTTNIAQDGFGTGTTASKRTNRFGMRSLQIAPEISNQGQAGTLQGRVPYLLMYPGTLSFYPSDQVQANRWATPKNFIAIATSGVTSKPVVWGPLT